MSVTKQRPPGQLKGRPFHCLVVDTHELVLNMHVTSSQEAKCL